MSVVSFEEGELKEKNMDPCFAVWDKTERCDNCVSLRACTEKKRMTKFEIRENEIFSVVAMPFLVKDKNKEYFVSLELVNHITEDMTVSVKEEGDAAEQIKFFQQKIYRDSLTGAYNRRYYDEKQYIYEMTDKIVSRLGFIVIDINKFKHVNDTYGHANGDDLLLHVANTLNNNIRSTDRVIRVGGDEFLVVLKDCNRDFVEKKLRQMKKSVLGIILPWLGEFRPSIAAGMSYTENFNGTEEELKSLFQEADEKMYENKSMPIEVRKEMLIVDDIEMSRASLRAHFENEFVIYEAENGLEALEILKKNMIEIVITDIFMPKMDGFELMKTIRRMPECEKTIIFAITDRGQELELKALEAGADDFINKPFSPELLNHRIKGVLSQNTIFNRISQYQLSFNQNQIPFATVKVEQDSMIFEYVNDAFAQLMDGTPEEFISGRKKLHYKGFLEIMKEVSVTHQRRQIHVHDDVSGNYYDIVAYAQDNGFCSFIIFRNDAFKQMKDSEERYEQEFENLLNASPNTQGAFFIDFTNGICKKAYGASPLIKQIKCPLSYDNLLQILVKHAATEKVKVLFEKMTSMEYMNRSFEEGQGLLELEVPCKMLNGTTQWLGVYIKMHSYQKEEKDMLEGVLYYVNIHSRKISQLVIDMVARKNLDSLYCIDAIFNTIQTFIGVDKTEWSAPAPIGEISKLIYQRLKKQYIGEDKDKLITEDIIFNIMEKMKSEEKYEFYYSAMEEDGQIHKKIVTCYWLDEYRTSMCIAREDISTFIEKEQWQRVNEERNMYQMILDHATAMITVIDAETYQILYANKAAKEVTKDMPEGYIGSICYACISHRDKPCDNCLLLRKDDMESEVREISYGDRVYRMLYKITQWNGRKALLEYSEDITDQKKVDAFRKILI